MGASDLANHYANMELRWEVTDRTSDYGRLVTASTNQHEQVHRWFNLKEAYSAHLLNRLFKDAAFEGVANLSILDPFCGSGTTLVSAGEWAVANDVTLSAVGIERNPFLATLCRSKIASLTRGPEMAQALSAAVPQFWADAKRMRRKRHYTPSATLNNSRYFSSDSVQDLLAMARAATNITDDDVRNVMAVCIASSIEPAGKLRRDGRALRYTPDRSVVVPKEAADVALRQILADLRNSVPLRPGSSVTVFDGDARDASALCGNGRGSADWIVFSPPYPNNIDYTEVYKLENWVLELWGDEDEMQALRHRTLRSHPSVKFPDHYPSSDAHQQAVREIIDPLLASIPDDRYTRGRMRLIKGYVDDMLTVFHQTRMLVAPTGRMAFVVGNSRHGHGADAFVVAADLVLAAVSELAGWKVQELRIGRQLGRRGTNVQYMRETVVILEPDPSVPGKS